MCRNDLYFAAVKTGAIIKCLSAAVKLLGIKRAFEWLEGKPALHSPRLNSGPFTDTTRVRHD